MTDRETIEALSEALDDEYKSRATYRKVIERFGAVRPFVNIVDAEERHVEALLRLFERLGEAPPADEWPKRVAVPESLARACANAVEAEIQNDAMYARLLQRVSDPQAREVMLRLQEASRSHHLPAFRRCLERETRGGGQGQGWGRAS